MKNSIEELVSKIKKNPYQLVLAKSNEKIKFQILYDGDEWIANNSCFGYSYEYSEYRLEVFLEQIQERFGIDEIEFIEYDVRQEE